MKHTFFLKEPKSRKNTLILFTCYFKNEEKKFVYSTGENINPKNWNKKTKFPILTGKNRIDSYSSIPIQLGRYTECFNKTEAMYMKIGEDFTSQILRNAFDEEFKKAPAGKNLFFDAFKDFIDFNTKKTNWSKATIKRYNNVKNILEEFEKKRKYKLTFNSINNIFDAEFADYCINELKHINNTYSRNLGFLKTFLYWSLEKGYTYNDAFKIFKPKKEEIIKHVVLKKEDLEKLMQHSFKSKSRERVRDIFVFACVTGMRFGELKLIKKENVVNNNIELKEEKDLIKKTRYIPLNDVSMYILKKYNYKLPLLANQKHNEYIKDVFEETGYTHNTEKILTRGKDVERIKIAFNDRVSSHTARRTFVTMMKHKGISDKLIGNITGQTPATINKYYQIDVDDTKKAVKKTFNFEFLPKLKKA